MPLRESDAKTLIRRVLESGNLDVSDHASAELAKDKLTTVDAVNVLRGGVVRPAEYENGSWRYRVETPRMCVVVAFDPEPDEAESEDEIELVLVTAWRKQP